MIYQKQKCLWIMVLLILNTLYYLKKRGVEGVTGKIDYPLLKQTLDVFLEDEDIEEIEIVLKHIKGIVNEKVPENIVSCSVCKKCSYYDLCFI